MAAVWRSSPLPPKLQPYQTTAVSTKPCTHYTSLSPNCILALSAVRDALCSLLHLDDYQQFFKLKWSPLPGSLLWCIQVVRVPFLSITLAPCRNLYPNPCHSELESLLSMSAFPAPAWSLLEGTDSVSAISVSPGSSTRLGTL